MEEVDLLGLREMVAKATAAGYAEAVSFYEPLKDFLRVGDARQWVERHGLDWKQFKKWEKAGYVKKVKLNDKPNSPWGYSIKEIAALRVQFEARVRFEDDIINSSFDYHNRRAARCVSMEQP